MLNIADLAAKLIGLAYERNEYVIQDDKLAAQKFCPRGLSRKMVRESIREIDEEFTQTLAQIAMLLSGEGLVTELYTELPLTHPAIAGAAMLRAA